MLILPSITLSPLGHNSNCHVMLTLRTMDEYGTWLSNARKVYDLNENGERIRLPFSEWKSFKENKLIAEDLSVWTELSVAIEKKESLCYTLYLHWAFESEKGDVKIYEIRNRNILTDFHNSMYLYKSP